ncbi:MAG: hypothetical protein A2428_08230 [Bdellovibrionales bacterium RIFOXYC1_FULL_54_43]|nr:MAG: hypothetical protein A2428_08230 [Bdellovibrionales bacterium RIFOXYC1_FULL_54_43]OFZ83035.1 MAG: hypothetical protein A2603_03340 [Bdellovibrionales bacterium RIFOXYD1_FULL_55_31]
MKNEPLLCRCRYALKGVRSAFKTEASFRTQIFFAVLAILALAVLRPKPIWWALALLTIASLLATELINTAIETILDRVHPEQHPLIARAKDCAAGAVFMLSLASVAVWTALILDLWMN